MGDSNGASAGENDEVISSLTEEEKKEAFAFQNPWKKLAIVLGGPGFNYLFAILVFALMFITLGKFTFPPVVGDVIPEGAAYEAGIKTGDRITEINGKKIKTFSDISTEIALITDGKANIKLIRNEENLEFSVNLKPLEVEENGTKTQRPMLGIKSQSSIELDNEKLSVAQAFVEATSETWRITVGTLRGVKQMIVGDRGTEDLGGILRIAEMSGDISKKNGLVDFIAFMALLSINLGLINLFPIPVLDGGHVVIFLVEIITRKEINPKVKEFLFKCGFALLIALMLFATWNDIVHLFKRWFV